MIGVHLLFSIEDDEAYWFWLDRGLDIILAVSSATKNWTERRHDYERVKKRKLHTDDGVLPQQEPADDDWSRIFRARVSHYRLHISIFLEF